MRASDLLIWQLADSAFPTGGFAHSWGLEAAWQRGRVDGADGLRRFVLDVLRQTGHGSLPFVNAAHARPHHLEQLDALADVVLTNPVANRASRVQGRAFVSTCARVWPSEDLTALRTRTDSLCGHVAPLAGAVMRALDVPLSTAQRLVLLTAARGVLAAAVRLGIVGSYDAQRLQHAAGPAIDAIATACGALLEDDVTQTAPILDLLQATHDKLYSRLFQS